MYAKYRITPPYAELSFHGSTTTSSSAGEHKVWHGSTAPAGPVRQQSAGASEHSQEDCIGGYGAFLDSLLATRRGVDRRSEPAAPPGHRQGAPGRGRRGRDRKCCAEPRSRRAHRAGDAVLTARSGHGPLLGLARNAFANTRAGFLAHEADPRVG